MPKKVKRLHDELQPKHYILDLRPDKEAMKFSGTVIISGQKSGRPSKRITLHQNGLKITKAHVIRHDRKGDTEIKISRINHHQGLNEVRLHADELVFPGQYTISVNFSGKITRPMNGMYPCFFKYKGKEKKLIATQFESHHAREVFPCVDEPEAKATFDLSITASTGEAVISNTPVLKETKTGKFTTTTFETTPHMSTYLLAFIYGELGYKEAKTKDGVVVRVYATPENVGITDFALETAVRCLEFYNDYFGVDYPLPKCDLVALPDFAAAAMENWGCITFREQALLVDPKHTSLSNKQLVAHVIAHELTHQWFGNLVTMRWWNDLWLNEGFATWMSYLGVDHLFPEWHMWTQFIVDEQQQALKLDALEHTHPVEVPINHPDEIKTIFDAISYEKGASSIHMLHNYLGGKDFKAGLQYYLKKHAYNSTKTDDLWGALEEISGKPVKEFMHAWTTQPGFPLVKATINDTGVNLSQQRFYVSPDHSDLSSKPWPIALMSGDNKAPELFGEPKASFKTKETTHFKINRGQSGFYRTVYNTSHLVRLGDQIKKGHLSPLDRLGLLADLTESAKAGLADTADALEFLKNFKQEDNYAVWDTMSAVIGSLRGVMNDDDLRELMKPFIRDLVSSQLERMGWDTKKDESHFDQLLRPIILGLAATADEPSVVKKCEKLFASIKHSEDLSADLRTSPNQIRVKRGGDLDPDLRGIVFGTVARRGGKAEFDKLFTLHNKALLSEERVTLAAALSGFKQPKLIDRALEIIKSDDVRLQDAPYWIVYSFLNHHAKETTWQWLKDNWGWLQEHLGSDHSFFRMPIYSARAFSDKKFLKDYKQFFKSVMTPALERSFKQGVEMIQWQSAWKERSLKEVKTFFKAQ